MANTPARAIRIDDELWIPALARARSEGSDLSTELRWFTEWLASPEMDLKPLRARYRDWQRFSSEEGASIQPRSA